MGLRAWGLESSRCSLISCLLFVLSFGSCVFVCVSLRLVLQNICVLDVRDWTSRYRYEVYFWR